MTTSWQLQLRAKRICTAARLRYRSLDTAYIAAVRTVYDALVREGCQVSSGHKRV